MKTIWKFPIPNNTRPSIWLPKGSKILSVKYKDGAPCVWVLVDPDPEIDREYVSLALFETGESIYDESIEYIDTIIADDGYYVSHVFKIIH